MSKFERLVDGVVGGWYGDESKALTVARKAKSGSYDYVARYNGGNNAGGKVVTEDGTVFKFNLLPAGLAYGIPAIIGRGVLLNTAALYDEIEAKREQGLSIDESNLFVSDQATLILPEHIYADQKRENGSDKQGSTKKGISFAAADRYGRRALTGQMLAGNLKAAEARVLDGIYTSLAGAGRRFSLDSRIRAQQEAKEWAEKTSEVLPYMQDTVALIQAELAQDKRVLAEGAQSLGLGIESRDYPLVTSSHPGPAGIQLGLGVNFQQLGDILAVVKATPSRVGEGPFPTEIQDSVIAARVRGEPGTVDGEYGTVTGRERRVGWPDLYRQKQLLIEHGISKIALTKLDCVPRYGEEVLVAKSYEDGEPQYTSYPTWDEDIQDARGYWELPGQAQEHIRLYEQVLDVDIETAGVGPNEDQFITL
jgi:adenylosuccinate synthase